MFLLDHYYYVKTQIYRFLNVAALPRYTVQPHLGQIIETL